MSDSSRRRLLMRPVACGKIAPLFSTGLCIGCKLVWECESGGIGRHARFRFWCRKAWEFKSLYPHQLQFAKRNAAGFFYLTPFLRFAHGSDPMGRPDRPTTSSVWLAVFEGFLSSRTSQAYCGTKAVIQARVWTQLGIGLHS